MSKRYTLQLSAGIADSTFEARLFANTDDDAIKSAVDLIRRSAFASVAHRAVLWDEDGDRLSSWDLSRETLLRREP
jgi:hypothetical protein